MKRFLFYLQITCCFSAFSHTMIGGSGKMALDTREGDLLLDSSSYANTTYDLRLSTIWDGGTEGSLAVNGVEKETLGESEEVDCQIVAGPNVATVFDCTFTVDEKVYTRRLYTEGAWRKGASKPISYNSSVNDDGSRVLPTFDTATLTWDASWIGGDASAEVVILDNDVEVKRTTGAGKFVHSPSGIGRHELTYTTYTDGMAQDETYSVTIFKDWKYEVVNGGAIITDTAQRYGTVTIPAKIDGLPVVAIGADVFAGCSDLTSIDIPASVKKIGERAFSECSGIESIIFEGDAPSVGDGAFDGVNENCRVVVPNNSVGWDSYIPGTWQGMRIDYEVLVIKLNANGGAVDVLFYQTGGGVVEESLPVATRTGYSFTGWWTEAAGGERIDAGATLSNSIIAYAQWTVNKYTVTFDANGGDGGKSETLDYGSAIVCPGVTRTGYTFVGWDGEVVSTVPAEDVTYTAQWTVNQYSVTFDANGGEGGKTQTLDYGAAIAAPTVTRTGHTFAGWSPVVASVVPAYNVTYTAQWTVNKYTVTFDANGGDGGKSETLNYGSAIVCPGVTRTGYTFVGWDGEVVSTVPAEDVTYTAQWTVNQYSVTFDANGGEGGKTQTLDYGAAIAAPTVTRTGHTFAGWSPVVASVVPAYNVTYTAQWTVNKYTVTFDANGGEVGVSEKRVAFDSEYGELPVPTRENYLFSGWFTAPDGGEEVTSAKICATADNHTIYAHWTYFLAYSDNGDGTSTVTGVNAASVSAVLQIPCEIEGLHVTAIGETAFMARTDIERVVVPSGVTSVGYYAFRNCSSLEEISLPSTLTNIATAAFEYCTALKSIEIPASVTNIGTWLFSGCTSLESVILHEGIKAIPYRTFYGCTSLADISIPDGVMAIGDEAFYNCTSLASLDMPDTVASIGQKSFMLCSGLETAKISDGITVVPFGAFFGCTSLVNVEIGRNVGEIGEEAFRRCGALRGVTIPDAVTNINKQAFRECRGLVDVTIPDSVEKILDYAFAECSNLANVTFGTGIKIVGYVSFGWCNALERVTFHGGEAPYFGSYAFYDLGEKPEIRVAYGSTGWECEIPGTWNGKYIDYISPIIKLDANGGEVDVSICQTDGGKVCGDLPDAKMLGYSFAGWWTDATGGERVLPGVSLSNSITAYAHWTANQYTVTFDANGGEGGKSEALDCGAAIVPPTVARTGYTFAGWSPEVAATVPAGDVTYVAQWEAHKHTVRILDRISAFNAAGLEVCYYDLGSDISTDECYSNVDTYEKAIAYRPSASPTVFANTLDLGENVDFGEMYDLWQKCSFHGKYSEYDADYFAVRLHGFIYSDTARMETFSIQHDDGCIVYIDGVKVYGHWGSRDIRDWRSFSVELSEGLHEILVWFEEYTGLQFLRFQGLRNDMCRMPHGTMDVVYGEMLPDVEIPSREGYTFMGFFTAQDESGDQYIDANGKCVRAWSIDEDANLYAHWQVNQYTVEFDANGGDGGKTESLDYGNSITAPTVTRTGYTFAGWSPDVAATVPAKDVTYTAQWEINQYIVTFDTHGGTGGKTETLDYGSKIIVPTVTRTGYTFAGWSPAIPATVSAENATYTAQWTANRYKVSFDAAGGDVDEVERTVSYDSEYGELPVPTRTDYEFVGWFTAQEGGEQVDASTIYGTAGNVTLYAYWRCIWLYSVNDGKVKIEGSIYGADYEGALLVPATIEGMPVTSIGEGAFSGYSKATEVTLPEGLETIGAGAFAGCSGLTSIEIPGGVTNIERGVYFEINNAWDVEDLESDDTSKVYRSTKISHNGETSMSITVDVQETIDWSFDWQVSSELSCDWLHWYLDGAEKSSISGTGSGWETINFTLSEGAHSIEWRYTKDGSVDTGDDCGWVRLSRLTGNGSPFVGCTGLRRVTVPVSIPCSISELFPVAYDKLQEVELTGEIAEIPAHLFEGCASLRDFDIPASVKMIGERAFADCTSLESLTLPDGLETIGAGAFDGCENIGLVSRLPDSLTSLGTLDLRGMEVEGEYEYNGFRICNGWVLGYDDDTVDYLEVPEGIVGIAPYAFSGLWDLEEVVLPESLKYIGYRAFYDDGYLGERGELVIPDGVEVIEDEAFKDCSWIPGIQMGGGVRKIGARAFEGNSSLTTLRLPDAIEEIGDNAFLDCNKLRSVKLPALLEKIGTDPFAGCSVLTGVTVPVWHWTMAEMFASRYSSIASVTLLGGEGEIVTNAFKGCSSLTDIVIPIEVTNICDGAFMNCYNLTAIELPENLETIGADAFRGCSRLAAIVLPDSVTSIGTNVFYGCGNLGNVTLSRSITEIPDYAFYNCYNLKSIVMPAAVTNLGNYISTSLQAVYFLCSKAPAYGENVYSAMPSWATTYVKENTRGWDGRPSSRVLPDTWNGRAITTWTPTQFDATFDANGGTFELTAGTSGATTYACQQITDTSYALPPFEPVWEGHVFDGWWTAPGDGAQITARTRVVETREVTYYAHWIGDPKEVTVRFNANGGTVAPDEGSYYASRPYGTLPVPTREYYRFAGWWTLPQGGSRVVVSSAVPAANQELYAHWTPETYIIRYHANGGSGSMADQYFTYGSTVTLRANQFNGKDITSHFAGWAISPDGPAVYADGKTLSTIAAIQDGVINLYAVWSGVQYAVRFDSNGGYGEMANQTLSIGVEEALHANEFERTGFEFIGWTKTPSGDVVYADGARVADLASIPESTVVLYAVWRLLSPMPEVGNDADVAVVMADAPDSLKANITNLTEYAEYRSWADGKMEESAAVSSANGWLSFALDADGLIAKEITSEDLEVSAFEPTDADGEFSLEVSLKDVAVGDQADGERLARVFGVEGSTTLDADGFTSENVTLEAGEAVEGKVRLTAKPKAVAPANVFFIRVKLNR